jgi:hypothetical protein
VSAGGEVKNVVLVHGGFVDGPGWQGVYDQLTADGQAGPRAHHHRSRCPAPVDDL